MHLQVNAIVSTATDGTDIWKRDSIPKRRSISPGIFCAMQLVTERPERIAERGREG